MSCQNRIKSKDRSRMKSRTMDDLMMIALNGPPPHKVDFHKVLQYWREASARGRYKGSTWTSDAVRLANQLNTGTGIDE